jgi:hypothetical protein
MSKKPAWEALDQLINHEWHTSIDTVCSANADLKGFYGEYEVEAEHAGKKTVQKIRLFRDNTGFDNRRCDFRVKEIVID